MHRYFSWRRGPESVAVELPNGSVWDKTVFPEWRYPLAVLAEATREFQQERLHFYFTRDARALPEYGNHVVVILWQEERCKVPTYARHVRGVIRCLEATPFLGFRPGPATNKYEMVLTFQYLRDWATHLLSQRRFRNPPTHWPAPVHEITRVLTIPLGYHSQIELPQIPMSERKLDAFFTGEVRGRVAKTTYQYWTSDSKTEARKQLWNALMELRKNPEWRIEMANISGGEGVPRVPQFSSYSQNMMNARICLAPRGTMAETFRFYEGLRAGCLVICNRLPPEPFLEGAPVIQIDNWKELPGLMQKYARDLDALEHYRCASLEFWNTRLSEPVIGRKVAKFLRGEPVIWPDKTTDLEESETG
jgi:hypothetical protein